ncbi:MAG: hypothetical protein JWQ75_2405 [Pseudarthrobacter sp.]|nr:hypothetical protein [Pseudarthrobacter sp.]
MGIVPELVEVVSKGAARQPGSGRFPLKGPDHRPPATRRSAQTWRLGGGQVRHPPFDYPTNVLESANQLTNCYARGPLRPVHPKSFAFPTGILGKT